MTNIPEPIVDFNKVEETLKEAGDFSYFKSILLFRKGKWVVYSGKDYRVLDSYDSASILSEIIKLKVLLQEQEK